MHLVHDAKRDLGPLACYYSREKTAQYYSNTIDKVTGTKNMMEDASKCICMICLRSSLKQYFRILFANGQVDLNNPSAIPLQAYCIAFEDVKYARENLNEYPGLSNETFFKEACDCIDWREAQKIPEDSSPAYASWWDRVYPGWEPDASVHVDDLNPIVDPAPGRDPIPHTNEQTGDLGQHEITQNIDGESGNTNTELRHVGREHQIEGFQDVEIVPQLDPMDPQHADTGDSARPVDTEPIDTESQYERMQPFDHTQRLKVPQCDMKHTPPHQTPMPGVISAIPRLVDTSPVLVDSGKIVGDSPLMPGRLQSRSPSPVDPEQDWCPPFLKQVLCLSSQLPKFSCNRLVKKLINTILIPNSNFTNALLTGSACGTLLMKCPLFSLANEPAKNLNGIVPFPHFLLAVANELSTTHIDVPVSPLCHAAFLLKLLPPQLLPAHTGTHNAAYILALFNRSKIQRKATDALVRELGHDPSSWKVFMRNPYSHPEHIKTYAIDFSHRIASVLIALLADEVPIFVRLEVMGYVLAHTAAKDHPEVDSELLPALSRLEELVPEAWKDIPRELDGMERQSFLIASLYCHSMCLAPNDPGRRYKPEDLPNDLSHSWLLTAVDMLRGNSMISEDLCGLLRDLERDKVDMNACKVAIGNFLDLFSNVVFAHMSRTNLHDTGSLRPNPWEILQGLVDGHTEAARWEDALARSGKPKPSDNQGITEGELWSMIRESLHDNIFQIRYDGKELRLTLN